VEPDGREKLSRKADTAQVLGALAFVETPLIAIAALAGEEWQQRVAIGVAGLVLVLAVVWSVKLWRSSTPLPIDDDEIWRKAVRDLMRATWTGQGSPLSATEQLRQDLVLKGDSSWLHPRFREGLALADGVTVDLKDVPGAGGLFDKLEGSYLRQHHSEQQPEGDASPGHRWAAALKYDNQVRRVQSSSRTSAPPMSPELRNRSTSTSPDA